VEYRVPSRIVILVPGERGVRWVIRERGLLLPNMGIEKLVLQAFLIWAYRD